MFSEPKPAHGPRSLSRLLRSRHKRLFEWKPTRKSLTDRFGGFPQSQKFPFTEEHAQQLCYHLLTKTTGRNWKERSGTGWATGNTQMTRLRRQVFRTDWFSTDRKLHTTKVPSSGGRAHSGVIHAFRRTGSWRNVDEVINYVAQFFKRRPPFRFHLPCLAHEPVNIVRAVARPVQLPSASNLLNHFCVAQGAIRSFSAWTTLDVMTNSHKHDLNITQ